MSTHPFAPRHGPIIVDAEATGPNGVVSLKLLIDTGATTSVINLVNLLYFGFDANQPFRRLPVTSVYTVAIVPVFALTRLSA